VARLAHRVVPVLGAAVTISVLVAASALAKLIGLAWFAAGVLVVVARDVEGGASSGRQPRVAGRQPSND
jgi:hypothetical protein